MADKKQEDVFEKMRREVDAHFDSPEFKKAVEQMDRDIEEAFNRAETQAAFARLDLDVEEHLGIKATSPREPKRR